MKDKSGILFLIMAIVILAGIALSLLMIFGGVQ
jgi:hypothetical protein